MSHNTNRNVPAVRFAGFEGEWERREFKECFCFLNNNTLSRACLTSEEEGDVQNIHYGDVLIKFDAIIDVAKERIPHIRPQFTNASLKIDYLRDGDVIIADTAEDSTVGKCSELVNIGDVKVVSGLHTMPCRPQILFGKYYLGYYLNSRAFHEQLIPLMQGIKVTSVSKGAITNTQVSCPREEEQSRIGQFFQTLDKLIELRQKKLERLILLKKQLLNKLFPRQGQKVPDIRFAGFEGEWRNRMIKCLAQFRRGLTYKPSDVVPRGVRVLRSSNIEHGSICYRDDDVFVRADAVNIDNVKKGDILVTAANGSSHLVGKHAVITGSDLAVHGGFMLLLSAKEPYFFNANMSSPRFRNLLNICIAGGNGAIGNLKTNELAEMAIYVPQEGEQTRIGQFFQTLDKLIELLQKELEKQRTLKRALLREMFV